MINKINPKDYTYDLPAEKIAAFPLVARDKSRLLVYQDGQITHSRFDHISSFLPDNAILFFNNTKVIPARLLFQKSSGATIEIFLLTPAGSSTVMQEVMQSTERQQWQCTIGNVKRWKSGIELTNELAGCTLRATLVDRQKGIVAFSWSPPHLTFGEIIERFGVTPLPPYIQREVYPEDRVRYQTIYSSMEGAVAAPTAGLHFTQLQLDQLDQKGIISDFLTLHVSAGTFQPIKVEQAADHDMHSEQIIVTDKNIQNLLLPDKKIVAVGTTSLRTLESLFWYGVRLLEDPEATFSIQKLEPYQNGNETPSVAEAVGAVASFMKRKNITSLAGETSIYVLPGYEFKICNALITNFHQPGSTLMLLVAAFVGEDWREIYDQALAKDYRFLSYGDSSLLIK